MGSAISDIASPSNWATRQLFGGSSTAARVMDPASIFADTTKKMGPQGDVFAGGGPIGGGFDGQQYDSQGRPVLGNREQIAEGGNLQSQYQTVDKTNTAAMDQARQEALRTPGELSRYGQMALAQGQNQNAMSAAGKQSQALNGLAMQGGLRSGARERLAASGMQGQLQANQNTYSTIQQQDEQSRQNQLQQQVGNEATYGQNANAIQNTNIGRAIGDKQTQDQFNMDRYGKAMEAWGADKSAAAAKSQAAQAKATSGLFGGGGFLGLGIGSK